MPGAMPPLSDFAGIYQGKPIIVVGTGPSAFDKNLGQSKRFLELAATRIPIIGMNRAFQIPNLRINYQISIDRIWRALINKKRYNGAAWESFQQLQDVFKAWQARYPEAADWTVEDFATAYKSELNLHDEVWRYLQLCSPHAPFIRFTWAGNSGSCPYRSVRFNKAKKQDKLPHGKAPGDALMVGGNVGQAGIHLAHVMGGLPIFLMGVDLSDPDVKKRPWEVGARYRYDKVRDPIDAGYRLLANKMKGKTHVINLNPKTHLRHFEKAASVKEGMDRLEKEIIRAKLA